MKSFASHIAPCVFLIFLAAGCDRPAPTSGGSGAIINGYRIEGQLFDEFLRPLAGVQVILYYSLAYSSGDSVSRAYTPATQGEFVTIEVKNSADQAVRVLFAGPAPQDTVLYVRWDGLDDSGNVVKSGLYTVTYSVSNAVKKSYQFIVDGNQNAVSDAQGRFVIPEQDLPVDEIAPYYDSTDKFLGQFQVTDEVYLQFISPAYSRTYWLRLVKNRTTTFSVVLK